MRIGGVEMKLPIIVGAGACKTVPSLERLMRPDVSVGAVVLGSITPDFSKGNRGTLFWPDDLSEFTRAGFGLNSFGMPNDGYDVAWLDLLLEYPHPLIVSVAGNTVEEIIAGIRQFDSHPGVAAIEINLGCPNNHQDRVVPQCYNWYFVVPVLNALGRLRPEKPVWFKLSPFRTRVELALLGQMYPRLDFSSTPTIERGYVRSLLEAILTNLGETVKAVVFGNTLGNVVYRDDTGSPVTTPNGGQAGLSGPILKDINLDLYRGHADLFYEMQTLGMSIIGMGGVTSGDDGMDYLDAGFDAFGLVSQLYWSGGDPRVLSDLIAGSERLQSHLTKEN